MRRRRDHVCLLAIILASIAWCGCGEKQSTPIKMGLWESTTRRDATASAAVAAEIRKKGLAQQPTFASLGWSGQTIDPPMTVRGQRCFIESKWREEKERLARLPENCLFTEPFSEGIHGASSAVICRGGGMSIAIATKQLWADTEHMHLTMKSVITFQGVEGESVTKTEVDSRYLRADCGSVPPGESVIIK